MLTTVLIENAFTIVVVGTAFRKSRKIVLLAMIIALISYMGFNNYLLAGIDPANSVSENETYYTLHSLFFLAMFGLFISNVTKLSIIMSGLMLIQSILCFLMSINGGVIDNFQMPEYNFIYQAHEWFNSLIWGAECIVVYAATFTGGK